MSNEVSATPLNSPVAPLLLGAVARDAQVTLNWTTATGVVSYNVYQGTSANGESTTPVKTGITETSTTLTGLSNDTQYFFKIAAVNVGGTSQLSNEVSATPTKKSDFVITEILLSPTSPTANSTFSVTVTIKNQGAQAGTGGFLDVWSNQSATQACGAQSDQWAEISVLDVNASRTVTLTSIPAGSAGAKTLRVFIDSGCETNEYDEVNNQLTQDYTVQ
ncbi:hypothetical protein CCP3SC5AM1_740001 [Gammaproteobacteria bacterium]